MNDKTTQGPDPLKTLLAMPLEERIRAIAEDVTSGRDQFRDIDPFALAHALGVPQPESPGGPGWSFITYAERVSLEDYFENWGESSSMLRFLTDHVSSKRLKSLETDFERLDEAHKPAFGLLTAKERTIVEEGLTEEDLESNSQNGMNCVASYSVQLKEIELFFQADIEDDGSCLELRTPYDDGGPDLTNTITEEW